MADHSRPQALDATAIADRRRQVAALYLARQTQASIAARLGVVQQTVSDDLIALRREWRQESLSDVEAVILREVAELDEIEGQAAVQFAQTRGVEWLAARLKTKERRAKLLGLDRPAKVDWTSGGEALNLAALTSVLMAALEPFGEAKIAVAAALTTLEPNGH